MTYFFEAASRPGFLILGTVGICVQKINYSVHCKMFSRIPGCYPVDNSSIPCFSSWQSKISLDIFKCPWGSKISQVLNHWSRIFNIYSNLLPHLNRCYSIILNRCSESHQEGENSIEAINGTYQVWKNLDFATKWVETFSD